MKKISSLLIFPLGVLLLFTFMQGGVFTDYTIHAQNVDEAEKKLRAQLQQIEAEEAAIQASLNVQKQKTATVQRDVNILSDQIDYANLSIQKKNILIEELSSDIALKDQTVEELNNRMGLAINSMSRVIRETDRLDDTSLTEVFLGHDNISDFFVAADNYLAIQMSLDNLYYEILELKDLTEEEKIALENKQAAERDVKAEILSEKRTVEIKEQEKKNILAISKSTEGTYEQILADKRARAAGIRAALFQLRDATGISFGDALKLAQEAEKLTGVRAAFILGILKQESDLGKNVGTCNRAGDPAHKKWDTIMPGPVHYSNYLANGSSCVGAASPCSWRDDQTIFKRIVKALGRDFDTQPLSCPIASVGGWGGAMGPSQFIPATWASYESRIGQVVGVSIPNPWNPQHAFVATALYVKDLGAAAGGYTAEHTAAAKYYAGSNFSGGPGQSYGNSVLNHAQGFQEQINFLKEVE